MNTKNDIEENRNFTRVRNDITKYCGTRAI